MSETKPKNPLRSFVISKGKVLSLISEWACLVIEIRERRGEFEASGLKSFEIDMSFEGLDNIGDVKVTLKKEEPTP